jgi:hypothetical protein
MVAAARVGSGLAFYTVSQLKVREFIPMTVGVQTEIERWGRSSVKCTD